MIAATHSTDPPGPSRAADPIREADVILTGEIKGSNALGN
jgi:hypothetical protein